MSALFYFGMCRFFQLVYRSTLVHGAEALCKDFCLVRWLPPS